MATCLEQTGADKVVLVGHSAGGWLARAALANGEWGEGIASEDVVAGECEYEPNPGGNDVRKVMYLSSLLYPALSIIMSLALVVVEIRACTRSSAILPRLALVIHRSLPSMTISPMSPWKARFSLSLSTILFVIDPWLTPVA